MKSRIFNQILSSKRDWHTDDNWKHETCPITQEPISSINPNQVILFIDGFLYDKEALFKWLKTNPKSPMTQVTVTTYLQQVSNTEYALSRYQKFMNSAAYTCGLVGLFLVIKYTLLYVAQKELETRAMSHPCNSSPQLNLACTQEDKTYLAGLVAQYFFYSNDLSKCLNDLLLTCSLALITYSLGSPTPEENAYNNLEKLSITLHEMRDELEKIENIKATQDSPRP